MDDVNGVRTTGSQEPGQDDIEHKKSRPSWLLPVVVIVVVVVLVGGGFGVWGYVSYQQHQSALADCHGAVQDVTTLAKFAQSAVTNNKEAIGVHVDQVKDASTVQALKKSVDTAPKPSAYRVLSCSASMSTKDLQATTSQANRLSGEYQRADLRIRKAGQAVLASRDAKSLDDVKAGLVAKKGEAEKLLADSDGRVADGAVRDGLQNALNQANQVSGSRVKDYQDATNTLQAAMDQVNASIQQKTQADQEATQQSYTPTQGGTGRGYTPSYRPSYTQGGGTGGGGSTTTNQQSSTGGGSNWRDRLPPLDTTHHGCNPDGSCGIG